MKNIFAKFFDKKNITQQTQNHINSFSLFIGPDSSIPKIQININETSLTAAEQFAKAMIFLHHGVYYKDLIDLIEELSGRGPEYHQFCYALSSYLDISMKALSNLKTQKPDEFSDSPVIKPTSFSGK